MKRIWKPAILFFTLTWAWSACAAPARPEVKPRDQWVGLWYISTGGFEKALEDNTIVELREDGTYTTGRYNGMQFTQVMAQGKWKVQGDIFLDIRENELTASYQVLDQDRIQLSVDSGETLYLVRYPGSPQP